MVSHLQVWRFLWGRLVCLDVKDAFCSSLLIYNFRIFERRFGTRKFAVSIKVIQREVHVCRWMQKVHIKPADICSWINLPSSIYSDQGETWQMWERVFFSRCFSLLVPFVSSPSCWARGVSLLLRISCWPRFSSFYLSMK